MICKMHAVKLATKALPVTALTLGLSGVLSQPASANPSVILMYPSTDLLVRSTLRVNSDLFSDSLKTTTFGSGGLTYGIGSGKNGFGGRTEVGYDYIAAAPFGTVSFINRSRFNAKTWLYNNDDKGTRVVVGGWGLGAVGSAGNTANNPNVVYLLGSKRFGFGRVQVGVARALSKSSALATPAGNADKTYLQLGFDKELNRKIRFGVDYLSGKSNISALTPGVIIAVNDKASFRLGYIRYNDGSVAPSRNQILLALDYSARKGEDSEPAPAVTPAAAPVGTTPPGTAPAGAAAP